MKEILWSDIIQRYRDLIISHNLKIKTGQQLQEENIGSCQTCNLIKGISSIVFSTFFSIASQNLLVQSYTSRIVALFKQVLVALKEEKGLTRGIIEIINELLTIFVYKASLIVTERGAAIFIGTLIQKTNRFEQAPLSKEVAELISVYMIIPKEDDFKESEETLKFIKASNWASHKTPESTIKSSSNKVSDSGTSSWNTLDISENTPELNFLFLNEKKSNLWTP